MSRRTFLNGAGALVVAFAWPLPSIADEQTPQRRGEGESGPRAGARDSGAPPADQLDSWLAIDGAGIVTLFSGKVELGTGVQTALAQLVAEELDVPIARVRVEQGSTGRVPNQGTTAGSKTLQGGGPQVRRAAAEARQALLELASARLNVPVAQLSTADGIVRVTGASTAAGRGSGSGPGAAGASATSVSYADLIGTRRFDRQITNASTVALKPASRFHTIGKPVPRLDLPAKIAGSFEYVQNVRVPGMLHGRVVRPSAIGATLSAIDESSIRALPGIVRVVSRGNFVGIVAEREEQAIAAARQLAVTWTPPSVELPDASALETVLRAAPADARTLIETGDATATLAAAKTRLEATYSTPFQSHGSIGPSCAIADVRADEATIWSGTQGAYALRESIADLLGIPAARVRVNWTEASGCYGHNGADDVAADAALLSREVGKPVRVQWMRHDEHAWDPKGPAMLMAVRGAVNGAGEIVAWDYTVTTPTHVTRPNGRAASFLAGQLTGQALRLGAGGGDRNARYSYAIPNGRVTVRWLRESVLRPSAFRGLGAPANVFAIESFVDELAAAAHADPVQFRLRHLQDPRATAVIQRVAELARWQPRASASRATSASRKADAAIAKGRGVAFLQYENANAYVATIVDVDVDRRSGAVRVTRVYVAHDCGLIVNPDGLRNQIEGGTIQSISRTLKEQVRWDRRAVTSVDWQSYPILTFADVPDAIDIALIDRPDHPALGAGEPAACSAPAAIANAIHDATGVRLRALPFTPDRVMAALRTAAPRPA